MVAMPLTGRAPIWDVIIVGGGPAGLSAALILGRCRRRVLLVDANRPRNRASHALHGFLTRDGVKPRALRRIAREQLSRYADVRIRHIEAIHARRLARGFEMTMRDGTRHRCRKLLLATGVVDDLPAVEGLIARYGTSVFHCPYCDGWEARDQPLAVYGRGANVVGFAIELAIWSEDRIVCTDGVRLAPKDARRLAAHRIALREQPIARLEGPAGRLERIVFADGSGIDRRVMFFSAGQRQASDLAAQLGCAFTGKGAVATGKYEVTGVPGLFVAGDASRLVQLAIVAAAEGAQAAFAINTQLIKEGSRARTSPLGSRAKLTRARA
jgi:thioredoxin reductase